MPSFIILPSVPLVRKGQQKIRKGRAQTHSAFGHTDFVKLPSELNRRDKKAASSLCPFSPPRIFWKAEYSPLKPSIIHSITKIGIKTNFFDCFDIFSMILSLLRTKLLAPKKQESGSLFWLLLSCLPRIGFSPLFTFCPFERKPLNYWGYSLNNWISASYDSRILHQFCLNTWKTTNIRI